MWQLKIYDPVVPASAAKHTRAVACQSALEAATGVDAIVIMTPWPQFRELKISEVARVMRGSIVIDPYRMLDVAAGPAAGLEYFTLGAPPLLGAKQRNVHA